MGHRRRLKVLLLLPLGIYILFQYYNAFYVMLERYDVRMRCIGEEECGKEDLKDSLSVKTQTVTRRQITKRIGPRETQTPKTIPKPSSQDVDSVPDSNEETQKKYRCGEKATVTLDPEPVFSQMGKDWHWDWIRQRIASLWPEWQEQGRLLKHRLDIGQERKVKRILIIPGVLSLTRFSSPKVIKMGGPLGDLVQWADVIAGLQILGHQVILAHDLGRVIKRLREIGHHKLCKEGGFDLIYSDILGFKKFDTDYRKFQCRMRVLDAYGTEAMYNDVKYAKLWGYNSIYGKMGIDLKQFYTYYPHTPDNSFMGFVVSSRYKSKAIIKKENISMLYTKNHFHLKGKQALISAIQSILPVHATIFKSDAMPPGVINHGVVSHSEYQALAKKSRIFIGVGLPFESSGALEAIAKGSVIINPKFMTSSKQHDLRDFDGKPTSRRPSSQVSYLEKYVGPPHVYTIDIGNITEVKNAVRTVLHSKQVLPYIPHEFTIRGFLERLNSYIEHQDFCHPNATAWPPLSSMRVYLGDDGTSCNEVCEAQGLVCEPTYFRRINQNEAFQIQKVTCDDVADNADVLFPAVRIIGKNNLCILQKRSSLFSCAKGKKSFRRLCPCRDYIDHQIALCKDCL